MGCRLGFLGIRPSGSRVENFRGKARILGLFYCFYSLQLTEWLDEWCGRQLDNLWSAEWRGGWRAAGSRLKTTHGSDGD